MRMDENSNPEWKQMLGGISSGRKALEIISNLEKRNPGRELGTVWNGICSEYPYLAETKENDGE